jgi:hypothetical protein
MEFHSTFPKDPTWSRPFLVIAFTIGATCLSACDKAKEMAGVSGPPFPLGTYVCPHGGTFDFKPNGLVTYAGVETTYTSDPDGYVRVAGGPVGQRVGLPLLKREGASLYGNLEGTGTPNELCARQDDFPTPTGATPPQPVTQNQALKDAESNSVRAALVWHTPPPPKPAAAAFSQSDILGDWDCANEKGANKRHLSFLPNGQVVTTHPGDPDAPKPLGRANARIVSDYTWSASQLEIIPSSVEMTLAPTDAGEAADLQKSGWTLINENVIRARVPEALNIYDVTLTDGNLFMVHESYLLRKVPQEIKEENKKSLCSRSAP